MGEEALKAKAVTLAEQEKAVAVTSAEKQLEVATLSARAAEQYKREWILKGEGDAGYKELVIRADGALAQKLEAIKYIHNQWAAAFANRKTPTTVFSSGGNTGGDNDAQTFMSILTMDAAKKLSLNMEIPK